MFNEHTLDLGVTSMRKNGFIQGQMNENVSWKNAIIGTVESGDFWYGDLDMSDLSKLHNVAKDIGESIKIYHHSLDEPLTISA